MDTPATIACTHCGATARLPEQPAVAGDAPVLPVGWWWLWRRPPVPLCPNYPRCAP